MQDRRTYQKLGQFFQLPEGLSDEEFQIRISVQRLRTRVLDPELRAAVHQFAELCREASSVPPRATSADPSVYDFATTPEPDDKVLARLDGEAAEVSIGYIAVDELLGERLRRELDRRFLAVEPPPDASSSAQPT